MAKKLLENNTYSKFEPKWGKNTSKNSETRDFSDFGSFENTGLVSERFKNEMIKRLKIKGIDDQVVLKAMMETPRHFFVDSALSSRAYEDIALPIGYEQTISQPFVVARVIALARTLNGFTNHTGSNRGKVLEVGTGCGYQATVMSKCFEKVYSIERIFQLYDETKKRLNSIHTNVIVKFGDGLNGWEEKSPFDAIIFSASLGSIPIDLLSQVKVNGVMIMPVGKSSQNIVALVKTGKRKNDVKKHIFDSVNYVPIINGVQK